MAFQDDIEAAKLEIDLRTIEADDREEMAEQMRGVPFDEDDDEDDMILTSNGWVML